MIFNFVLFVSIVILLVVLSMVWPPNSPWAPWWRTSSKIARKMCQLAKVSKSDVIYDLGSGDGTALIVAAKEFGAKGVGIEIEPTRALISRFLIKKNNLEDKIKIKRQNFFAVNLSNADVIFLYLVPTIFTKIGFCIATFATRTISLAVVICAASSSPAGLPTGYCW